MRRQIIGFVAAAASVFWHLCRISDEQAFAVPPDHTETDAYHPADESSLEYFVSALSSSGAGTLGVQVAENIHAIDVVLRRWHEQGIRQTQIAMMPSSSSVA
jgi:hypothetical protein